jgi:hypothetical protein
MGEGQFVAIQLTAQARLSNEIIEKALALK